MTDDSSLPPDFNDILNQAEQLTDQQFSDVINNFTKLTPKELTDLNLTDAEKTQLVQLIQVVNAKTTSNERASAIMSILGTVGSIVVKLALKALIP